MNVAQLMAAAALAERLAAGRTHEICALGDLGAQGIMLRVGPAFISDDDRSHWLIRPDGTSEERPW